MTVPRNGSGSSVQKPKRVRPVIDSSRLDEGVARRPLGHDQPAGATAPLAGGDESRLDRQYGGGVEVGAVVDDQRVVAAHLQGQDFFGVVGQQPVELRPTA